MGQRLRHFAVVVLTVLLPVALAAQTVDGILESGKLKAAYNPVLLDYLLEEGADDLPEAQRKQAIDQLVTALKQDIEITPEEQKTAALLAAGAAMAQLLGGNDASDIGAAAGDATYDVWRGWVDSAMTLQRAGYTAEAEGFFEKCIEIYPYSDLRGRCAIGLAAGKPDEAVSRLMELTESSDNSTINAALRLLGDLAGSEGFPAATRSTVVTRLTEFTGGLKKATYGQAACDGLVRTSDTAVVPTLQKLGQGPGILRARVQDAVEGVRDVPSVADTEQEGGNTSGPVCPVLAVDEDFVRLDLLHSFENPTPTPKG